MAGFHLQRTAERLREIEELLATAGIRRGVDTGLRPILHDLNRRGHRAWLPFGRAVHQAWGFDASDRRTKRWYPQGVTTATDATSAELEGRSIIAMAWYAKDMGDSHRGCRITFYDTAIARYRHILLVRPTADDVPTLAPLKIHAGGLVWAGEWMHVAATRAGFYSLHVDDLIRVPDHAAAGDRESLGLGGAGLATYGYRYVWPARVRHQASADDGLEMLRFSFMSLDRESDPPQLVVGEYGRGKQTRRLARFPLDPATLLPTADEGGRAHALTVGEGVRRMQGVAVAGGQVYLTTSEGHWSPGSVFVGQPGSFTQHASATPMGPEDISYDPDTDLFWSASEHPHRRWLSSMKRSEFA